MRIRLLNSNPQENLKRARGFKLTYALAYDKFLDDPKNNLLFLYPLKMLFYRAVELYARNFLLIQGASSWKASRKIQHTEYDSHDLGALWVECMKYEGFIDDPKIRDSIQFMAGSTKNYSGAPYSESGAGGSRSDIEILEKLDAVVSAILNK